MHTSRLDIWLTVSQTEDKLSVQCRCQVIEQMGITAREQLIETRNRHKRGDCTQNQVNEYHGDVLRTVFSLGMDGQSSYLPITIATHILQKKVRATAAKKAPSRARS